ncbi:MAG: hypothetical protein HYX33_04370 [Actinobacteria bacterium]|nr:hypothetical protein [Actinomycetota bacterium]
MRLWQLGGLATKCRDDVKFWGVTRGGGPQPAERRADASAGGQGRDVQTISDLGVGRLVDDAQGDRVA